MSDQPKPSVTSKMGNAIGKAKNSLRDIMKQVMQNMDENFITIFIAIAIIVIAIMIVIYYFIKKTYVSRTCKTMDNLYSTMNTKISNAVTSTDPDSQYSLRDYYIKTAYNCCSLGSFKNSFVSICMFKDLVRQGVRGFDFEVYSIDDQPVISTSTEDDNFYVKETYNYVPFSQVMEIITNAAYSPNPRDPIIFHLRMMSTNIPMYENLAALFKRYDNFFLGPDYSFENGLKNIGEVKIAELQGKIVVIVDKSNMTFMDCKSFYEYVNMTSNSVFMRALRYYDVKNTPDMSELIQYNKKFMTIAMPDKGATPQNPNPIICREMGCQMIAMVYQNFDNYLAADSAFYDKNGTAFELKPERLRYIPVYIDDPAPQNPEYSFGTRSVSADYYKFDI